jgi:hypothetical protein
MIRTACAWVLLLLAASPVTAPFSSCDLRLFTMSTTGIQSTAVARFASISATESDGGDAYSLSPIVTRIVMPDDSPSVTAPPFVVMNSAAVADTRPPRDLNRSPHHLSASTALRL